MMDESSLSLKFLLKSAMSMVLVDPDLSRHYSVKFLARNAASASASPTTTAKKYPNQRNNIPVLFQDLSPSLSSHFCHGCGVIFVASVNCTVRICSIKDGGKGREECRIRCRGCGYVSMHLLRVERHFGEAGASRVINTNNNVNVKSSGEGKKRRKKEKTDVSTRDSKSDSLLSLDDFLSTL